MREDLKLVSRKSPNFGEVWLSCYAPGNGTLAFVWQYQDPYSGNWLAAGYPVSQLDIYEWLNHPKNDSDYLNNYEIRRENINCWVLLPIIKLSSSGFLTMKGRKFRFKVYDKDNVFWQGDAEIHMSNTKFFVYDKDEQKPWQETRHLSTTQSLTWFLNNDSKGRAWVRALKEADEINDEDLEAASEYYDKL